MALFAFRQQKWASLACSSALKLTGSSSRSGHSTEVARTIVSVPVVVLLSVPGVPPPRWIIFVATVTQIAFPSLRLWILRLDESRLLSLSTRPLAIAAECPVEGHSRDHTPGLDRLITLSETSSSVVVNEFNPS